MLKLDDSCLFVFDLTGTQCAAWVQAWGSILALFVAVGVGAYQALAARRLQERLFSIERQRQWAQSIAIFEGVKRAADVACSHVDLIQRGERFKIATEPLVRALDVLHQAVLLPLPAEAIDLLMPARGLVTALVELADQASKSGSAQHTGIAQSLAEIRAGLLRIGTELELKRRLVAPKL